MKASKRVWFGCILWHIIPCSYIRSNPVYIYIYIYIYIYTNLISTSIHGTRKKEKKTRQVQGIRISRTTARGKKKNISKKKKKEKANLVRPLEKNQGICSQLAKRKLKHFFFFFYKSKVFCSFLFFSYLFLLLCKFYARWDFGEYKTACSPLASVGLRLPDDPLRWNFSRRFPTRDLS